MIWSDLHGDMESQVETSWPLTGGNSPNVRGNSMNGPKVASQPPYAERRAVHSAICWKV